MSYYHYFKLKKDSKYKNWTPKEKKSIDLIDNSKNEFYVKMIQAYYDNDAASKVKNISWAVQMCIWKDLYKADEEYLNQMHEDENHELWRNRPMNDSEMQTCIEEWEDYLTKTIKSLAIISSIKFIPDDKYLDTSKTEMEYLQHEYINKIDEEMELLNEYLYDYTFAKFVTENCIRRTEDQENYPDEESSKDV